MFSNKGKKILCKVTSLKYNLEQFTTTTAQKELS
jgi:hypothetical protein